jgi:hypothetical protein
MVSYCMCDLTVETLMYAAFVGLNIAKCVFYVLTRQQNKTKQLARLHLLYCVDLETKNVSFLKPSSDDDTVDSHRSTVLESSRLKGGAPSSWLL